MTKQNGQAGLAPQGPDFEKSNPLDLQPHAPMVLSLNTRTGGDAFFLLFATLTT